MEVKYGITLVLLGYLVFIACCWKFFIIPKMNFLEENQNRNRIVPETQLVLVVPDIP
jgi:hypothetical protein